MASLTLKKNELLNDDVYVCVDCYEDHHEGRAMHDSSVSWTDNTNANDDDGETGIIGFTGSDCACCGSGLAGTRFRMAIWEMAGK